MRFDRSYGWVPLSMCFTVIVEIRSQRLVISRQVILSVMVWRVGTHLRLHLEWRVPALMIGNGADSPSSIRWRRLECDAIDGPSPSVDQHHPGDVDCSIWWLRAAGQRETAAFWRGNESPVEVQLIECSAYYVEYNETRSRREKAVYFSKRLIPSGTQRLRS